MQSLINNPMHGLPSAVDHQKVGYYGNAESYNDGYFWDELLEYRVRCRALPNDEEEELLYCFKDYQSAFTFYKKTPTTQELNALILQKEHITRLNRNAFKHIDTPRMVEWPAHFLMRPQGSTAFIITFLRLTTPQEKRMFLQQFVAN